MKYRKAKQKWMEKTCSSENIFTRDLKFLCFSTKGWGRNHSNCPRWWWSKNCLGNFFFCPYMLMCTQMWNVTCYQVTTPHHKGRGEPDKLKQQKRQFTFFLPCSTSSLVNTTTDSIFSDWHNPGRTSWSHCPLLQTSPPLLWRKKSQQTERSKQETKPRQRTPGVKT